jgi:site-specific DNA-methyltransferase (adenine-specific)
MKQEIVHKSIADLIPYANNARTHSDEQIAQIAASIKEFGFTNPILLDGTNGIIAGHGRLMAARKLSLDTVPCIQLSHLSDKQRKAYILADNRLAMNSGWDTQLLSLELKSLDDEGFDLEMLGFDAKELSDLLQPEQVEGLTDEDAVPDAPAVPVTKLGDVWLCGKHRVKCGDSCNVTDMESLTAGQPVDMWLTDPPYNVAYEGKTKDALKIQNDSMADEDFRTFLRDACVTADTVMKAGAVYYIWHAPSEGYNFHGACLDAGWKVRQCLIWKKSSMVLGRQDYHWRHESCLYGWKEGAGHLWATDRKQTTILEFDRPTRNGEHPTMKPVALFEYQMLNNTKGGDIVLDSFGGSGSTMIAAEKNGRYSRLMELDPKYCDVIVKRWQEFTGKEATLETNGKTFAEVSNG